MANYDLGTARGTIELAYKGDGPKQAKSDLDDLTSRSGRTSEAFDRVGGTMQKAGAAIGAGTGYGAGKGALIGTGVGAAAGAIYDITR